MIRCCSGGAVSGGEEHALADRETIQEVVRRELREVLGIDREPSHWHLFRWPRGLPQDNLGHQGRLARIDEHLERWPGLLLAGAAYRGVGIPDCIESGWQAALSARDLVLASAGARDRGQAPPGSPDARSVSSASVA